MVVDRRGFLAAGGAVGATVLTVAGPAFGKPAKPDQRDNKDSKNNKELDVTAAEDLMREHGVLRRVLLVYREAARRLEGGGSGAPDMEAVAQAARLVRTFVEDYHERQEEEVLFPLFERKHKQEELVRVLRQQHQAGRALTERVLVVTRGKDVAQRNQLRADLLNFVRMYEPHATREDTVLFPALHEIVTASEYEALGEEFERRERKIFGGEQFEKAVSEIDAIEKKLGIEDLAQFTPKA
jgi:hemerythrin-like domain-containing protein